MTKKMIERFVILNIENEVVTSVENIEANHGMVYNPKGDVLRVYDREKTRVISRVDAGDKLFNLHIAEAIVEACDSYVPPEPDETPEEGDENSSD
ncbi:MAG: hypothetical protein E7Z73_07770 [Methanobrevibacter millerae]|uniref:Uncharacterized protein n=1 Tax=Methanobrevibacter millerae TaxID=230361 RepID=A0A8T3VCA7_9EURY|nr:hypothetical protein [Methanobrevibacter millerae]MBE6505618.1 hypothetical protein [Methanobrevibacter millerae]